MSAFGIDKKTFTSGQHLVCDVDSQPGLSYVVGIPNSAFMSLYTQVIMLLGEKLSGYKSSKNCDVLVPGSKLTLLGITISWICNLTRTTQQLENSHAAWESGYSLANFPSQQEGSTCSGEDWTFPLFRQKRGSGPILALLTLKAEGYQIQITN
ncbi:hypothetical protein M8J77_017687 [Diaphorina citri]|nr:hypothetical protein M8J77_017687 [Diaphorina citri]